MEFNKQLKEAVVKLRADLPEAALTYVDIYAAKYALISDAKKQGDHHQSKLSTYIEPYMNIWSSFIVRNFSQQDL